MAANAPYLPQELVDSIIDHVDNDRSALFACALVSRSWLHSSRYHLFTNISLHPQADIPPQQLCSQLYHMLQESPVIIPYIRHLQIFEGSLPLHQHLQILEGGVPYERSGQWISSERTLPPLLKLLTNLRQFELSASVSSPMVRWKSLPFTLQNAICTVLKLPSLAYFRLHSWEFPNHVSLAALLSSCQHLKGLSLSCVTVCEDLDHHPSTEVKSITLRQLPLLVSADRQTTSEGHEFDAETDADEDIESGTNTANPRVSTPRLEVLTLDYVNFGYLGYWLFAPPQSPSPINFSHLRELRLSHSADPLVVEQILLSIGPSLEHLHLKPASWDVFPFDLRNNPGLKSLRLTLEVPETALSWCTTLLSSLSLSGLDTSCLPASSSTPPPNINPSTCYDNYDYDCQLTHISLEFWTDLKKLSSASQTPGTSPSTSPHHTSPFLSPSSSPPSSSSSPLSSSFILASASSTSSTFSTALTSVLAPTPTSRPVSTSTPARSGSGSRTPEQLPNSVNRQRRRPQPHSHATWSSLDSILSLLPSPLKQVDVGLFAQPSHPDFVRVKETLSGVSARVHAMDEDSNARSDVVEGRDVFTGAESPSPESVRGAEQGSDVGIVRVYQLGLKSKRSFGRICGPRLRSFEGYN